MTAINYEVFNFISDGILVIDRDFNIVFANSSILELCNLQAESVIGKKCHEISHGCPEPCQLKCIHEISGYHSLDRDGFFVNINDTELKWLGYTRDEIIGKKKFSDIITSECMHD